MTHDRNLDPDTAERLLAGSMSPEDSQSGYSGVARLFAAASASAAPAPTEAATVQAMVQTISSSPTHITSRRKTMLKKLLTAKAAAAVVLVLSASGAAAATGSLPGAAQDTASHALAHIGIHVSNNDHANGRGKSDDHKGSNTPDTHSANSNADFGLCTAADAHTTAGVTPNSNATVFPSDCIGVTHPGQPTDAGSQNSSHSDDSTKSSHGSESSNSSDGTESSHGSESSNSSDGPESSHGSESSNSSDRGKP